MSQIIVRSVQYDSSRKSHAFEVEFTVLKVELVGKVGHIYGSVIIELQKAMVDKWLDEASPSEYWAIAPQVAQWLELAYERS